MALHGGGHLKLKKNTHGGFLGTLRHSSGEMSRYHSWKNQLSVILFQVQCFYIICSSVFFFPKLAQCQQSWKYALLEMCMWKPMKQKPWTNKKIPFHYMNMMDTVNWANGNIYTWPYGQLIYSFFSARGFDFRHQNLTSIDVRFWRLKTVFPALKGLTSTQPNPLLTIATYI